MMKINYWQNLYIQWKIELYQFHFLFQPKASISRHLSFHCYRDDSFSPIILIVSRKLIITSEKQNINENWLNFLHQCWKDFDVILHTNVRGERLFIHEICCILRLKFDCKSVKITEIIWNYMISKRDILSNFVWKQYRKKLFQ